MTRIFVPFELIRNCLPSCENFKLLQSQFVSLFRSNVTNGPLPSPRTSNKWICCELTPTANKAPFGAHAHSGMPSNLAFEMQLADRVSHNWIAISMPPDRNRWLGECTLNDVTRLVWPTKYVPYVFFSMFSNRMVLLCFMEPTTTFSAPSSAKSMTPQPYLCIGMQFFWMPRLQSNTSITWWFDEAINVLPFCEMAIEFTRLSLFGVKLRKWVVGWNLPTNSSLNVAIFSMWFHLRQNSSSYARIYGKLIETRTRGVIQ